MASKIKNALNRKRPSKVLLDSGKPHGDSSPGLNLRGKVNADAAMRKRKVKVTLPKLSFR